MSLVTLLRLAMLALLHALWIIASAVLGVLLGFGAGVGIPSALVSHFSEVERISVVGLPFQLLGFVLGPICGLALGVRAGKLWAPPCPVCRHSLEAQGTSFTYRCVSCRRSFVWSQLLGLGDGETPQWLYRLSVLWRLPFISIFIGLALVMVLFGFPVIMGMFALAYVIGGVLNLGLWLASRFWGSSEAASHVVPWRDYLFHLAACLLMVPALLAPVVGWSLWILRAVFTGEATGGGTGAPPLLLVWGLLGVYYGLAGLVREWPWRLQQLQNIQNLPTAKARSVALGLAELRGTARAFDEDAPILYFNRAVFPDGRFALFEQNLRAFELEDETGRIRVDPSGCSFSVAFPLLALFTSLLGRRPFVAALTRRIRYGWWPSREFELRGGDPVYVLGTVDVERDGATGAERRVVRPPAEARQEDSVIEALMFPFRRRTRRDWQDAFIISDADESTASLLLGRQLASRIFWSLFWVFGSAGLFVPV